MPCFWLKMFVFASNLTEVCPSGSNQQYWVSLPPHPPHPLSTPPSQHHPPPPPPPPPPTPPTPRDYYPSCLVLAYNICTATKQNRVNAVTIPLYDCTSGTGKLVLNQLYSHWRNSGFSGVVGRFRDPNVLIWRDLVACCAIGKNGCHTYDFSFLQMMHAVSVG